VGLPEGRGARCAAERRQARQVEQHPERRERKLPSAPASGGVQATPGASRAFQAKSLSTEGVYSRDIGRGSSREGGGPAPAVCEGAPRPR
jgi:hypothetical protein